MFITLQKFRISTIIFGMLLLIAWSIFFRAKKSYREIEEMYTMQDFSQDASKVYFDMGAFAQKRGDWKTAIKFYQTALDHNQGSQEAEHSLKLCLNQCEFENKIFQKMK